VVGIRENDLASACRKPDELRLYFVNPHLLMRRSLFVQFSISEIECTFTSVAALLMT
jgi:hypothetical protein